MLILVLGYNSMNVIIHEADYRALIYKHDYDYAWGWYEILEVKKSNAKEIFNLDITLIAIVVVPLLVAFYICLLYTSPSPRD